MCVLLRKAYLHTTPFLYTSICIYAHIYQHTIFDNDVSQRAECAISVVVRVEIEFNYLLNVVIFQMKHWWSIAGFRIERHVDESAETVRLEILLAEAECHSQDTVCANLQRSRLPLTEP